MNKSDNEAIFLELINKNQNLIQKVCFVFSNNSEDRKDLFQEILLQLWKSFESFKGQSEFSTWMYRVGLNTAISLSKKRKSILDSEPFHENLALIDNSSELSEDIKLLYRAISKLNKIDRAIIFLWLEEKEYSIISDTIGISISNVSVRLVRIKSKLKTIIEELG